MQAKQEFLTISLKTLTGIARSKDSKARNTTKKQKFPMQKLIKGMCKVQITS